ncbi:MAG: hypothetical protein LBQ54_15420 [Planctomycetaceae bacterium]|nr:hypothetical protein [Planctomycetaceae bacterium]
MPPAGSGSPLHPCRLPASSRRSPSDGKSSPLEAEGILRCSSMLPRVARWSQQAEKRFHRKPNAKP